MTPRSFFLKNQQVQRNLFGQRRLIWKSVQQRRAAARREASVEEKQQYHSEFHKAKIAECDSRKNNDVFELVDLRKLDVKNYITGRWVLTVKRDKDGNFDKCKARWVLRGFQYKQIFELQTDSPTATRPGFRLQCHAAVKNNYDIAHIDLKTASLQGEQFDKH